MEHADSKVLSQDDNSAPIPVHGEKDGVQFDAILLFRFEVSAPNNPPTIAMNRDYSHYCRPISHHLK
jgi:hypothetical protein